MADTFVFNDVFEIPLMLVGKIYHVSPIYIRSKTTKRKEKIYFNFPLDNKMGRVLKTYNFNVFNIVEKSVIECNNTKLNFVSFNNQTVNDILVSFLSEYKVDYIEITSNEKELIKQNILHNISKQKELLVEYKIKPLIEQGIKGNINICNVPDKNGLYFGYSGNYTLWVDYRKLINKLISGELVVVKHIDYSEPQNTADVEIEYVNNATLIVGFDIDTLQVKTQYFKQIMASVNATIIFFNKSNGCVAVSGNFTYQYYKQLTPINQLEITTPSSLLDYGYLEGNVNMVGYTYWDYLEDKLTEIKEHYNLIAIPTGSNTYTNIAGIDALHKSYTDILTRFQIVTPMYYDIDIAQSTIPDQIVDVMCTIPLVIPDITEMDHSFVETSKIWIDTRLEDKDLPMLSKFEISDEVENLNYDFSTVHKDEDRIINVNKVTEDDQLLLYKIEPERHPTNIAPLEYHLNRTSKLVIIVDMTPIIMEVKIDTHKIILNYKVSSVIIDSTIKGLEYTQHQLITQSNIISFEYLEHRTKYIGILMSKPIIQILNTDVKEGYIKDLPHILSITEMNCDVFYKFFNRASKIYYEQFNYLLGSQNTPTNISTFAVLKNPQFCNDVTTFPDDYEPHNIKQGTVFTSTSRPNTSLWWYNVEDKNWDYNIIDTGVCTDVSNAKIKYDSDNVTVIYDVTYDDFEAWKTYPFKDIYPDPNSGVDKTCTCVENFVYPYIVFSRLVYKFKNDYICGTNNKHVKVSSLVDRGDYKNKNQLQYALLRGLVTSDMLSDENAVIISFDSANSNTPEDIKQTLQNYNDIGNIRIDNSGICEATFDYSHNRFRVTNITNDENSNGIKLELEDTKRTKGKQCVINTDSFIIGNLYRGVAKKYQDYPLLLIDYKYTNSPNHVYNNGLNYANKPQTTIEYTVFGVVYDCKYKGGTIRSVELVNVTASIKSDAKYFYDDSINDADDSEFIKNGGDASQISYEDYMRSITSEYSADQIMEKYNISSNSGVINDKHKKTIFIDKEKWQDSNDDATVHFENDYTALKDDGFKFIKDYFTDDTIQPYTRIDTYCMVYSVPDFIFDNHIEVNSDLSKFNVAITTDEIRNKCTKSRYDMDIAYYENKDNTQIPDAFIFEQNISCYGIADKIDTYLKYNTSDLPTQLKYDVIACATEASVFSNLASAADKLAQPSNNTDSVFLFDNADSMYQDAILNCESLDNITDVIEKIKSIFPDRITVDYDGYDFKIFEEERDLKYATSNHIEFTDPVYLYDAVTESKSEEQSHTSKSSIYGDTEVTTIKGKIETIKVLQYKDFVNILNLNDYIDERYNIIEPVVIDTDLTLQHINNYNYAFRSQTYIEFVPSGAWENQYNKLDTINIHSYEVDSVKYNNHNTSFPFGLGIYPYSVIYNVNNNNIKEQSLGGDASYNIYDDDNFEEVTLPDPGKYRLVYCVKYYKFKIKLEKQVDISVLKAPCFKDTQNIEVNTYHLDGSVVKYTDDNNANYIKYILDYVNIEYFKTYHYETKKWLFSNIYTVKSTMSRDVSLKYPLCRILVLYAICYYLSIPETEIERVTALLIDASKFKLQMRKDLQDEFTMIAFLRYAFNDIDLFIHYKLSYMVAEKLYIAFSSNDQYYILYQIIKLIDFYDNNCDKIICGQIQQMGFDSNIETKDSHRISSSDIFKNNITDKIINAKAIDINEINRMYKAKNYDIMFNKPSSFFEAKPYYHQLYKVILGLNTIYVDYTEQDIDEADWYIITTPCFLKDESIKFDVPRTTPGGIYALSVLDIKAPDLNTVLISFNTPKTHKSLEFELYSVAYKFITFKPLPWGYEILEMGIPVELFRLPLKNVNLIREIHAESLPGRSVNETRFSLPEYTMYTSAGDQFTYVENKLSRGVIINDSDIKVVPLTTVDKKKINRLYRTGWDFYISDNNEANLFETISQLVSTYTELYQYFPLFDIMNINNISYSKAIDHLSRYYMYTTFALFEIDLSGESYSVDSELLFRKIKELDIMISKKFSNSVRCGIITSLKSDKNLIRRILNETTSFDEIILKVKLEREYDEVITDWIAEDFYIDGKLGIQFEAYYGDSYKYLRWMNYVQMYLNYTRVIFNSYSLINYDKKFFNE